MNANLQNINIIRVIIKMDSQIETVILGPEVNQIFLPEKGK